MAIFTDAELAKAADILRPLSDRELDALAAVVAKLKERQPSQREQAEKLLKAAPAFRIGRSTETKAWPKWAQSGALLDR
jgi:hypothetical protein